MIEFELKKECMYCRYQCFASPRQDSTFAVFHSRCLPFLPPAILTEVCTLVQLLSTLPVQLISCLWSQISQPISLAHTAHRHIFLLIPCSDPYSSFSPTQHNTSQKTCLLHTTPMILFLPVPSSLLLMSSSLLCNL